MAFFLYAPPRHAAEMPVAVVVALTNLPDSQSAFNVASALLRERLAVGVLLALVAWGAAPLAKAQALLEPDQAFRPTVRLSPGETARVTITYEIAPGYYLYRDRFRIATVPPLPLGDVEMPPGEAINDPFIGPTRIFRQAVTLSLPFTASPRPGAYRVRITAQGCAEERFCYRPFVQESVIDVPAP